MGFDPEKTSMTNSQVLQDIFEKTEMVFKDVRKNATQAYIKYKAWFDQKANALKVKKRD